jgi:hypothetical protein
MIFTDSAKIGIDPIPDTIIGRPVRITHSQAWLPSEIDVHLKTVLNPLPLKFNLRQLPDRLQLFKITVLQDSQRRVTSG